MTAVLKIRECNLDDLTQIMNLHREAMEVIGAYKGDGNWDDDLKDIQNHYFDNLGIFLVGEIDGSIVTMGAIRRITPQTAEIKRMRTLPQYQGLGFGKSILQRLISFAKKVGYHEIILETSDKQLKAMQLYQSSGFFEFKKENIDGYNCTWYRLEL